LDWRHERELERHLSLEKESAFPERAAAQPIVALPEHTWQLPKIELNRLFPPPVREPELRREPPVRSLDIDF
jgi:hypothetical protein